MSRLYVKTFLLIGGIFFIVTTTMIVFVHTSGSRQIEEEGIARADTLNRMAFEALYASMRQGGGREGNLEVIRRLQEVGAFRSLRVVKGDPVVRQFGALPDELPRNDAERRALRGEVVREILQEDGERIVRYVTPLRVQPECQQCHQAEVGEINGAIATEISLAAYERTLLWRRNILLLVVGSGLLTLGILVTFGVRQIILKPLQALHHGVAAIASGNLDYRLNLRTGDEFQVVAEEFNRMAERLQRTYHDLRKAQEKTIAAIEASRNPIWVSDADRRIVLVNSALERLMGRPREELIGKTCRYLFGVRMRDGRYICDVTCPFVRQEHPDGHVEGRMPLPNGEEKWVEITYGYVRDEQGYISGVVHVVHDLTKYKEVERLKDEFLSLVSHELRTPLHHIKGFASTLLQTDVSWDPATQRDFLESINREADRLAELVEKILRLSRLRAGVLPMEEEWWSVYDIVDAALYHIPHGQEDRVKLELEPDLPSIFVDGREIELVLRNLLENAFRYAPEGPIILGARRAGDYVQFWVADHGPGIPEEEQQHIFEHFYRGSQGRQYSAGSGLGLAICKRIVEAHQGRIWVESAPGKGTCFYFLIPIEPHRINREMKPEVKEQLPCLVDG